MATAPAAKAAARATRPTAHAVDGARGSAARRAGTRTAAAGATFGVLASGAFAAVVPTTLDGTNTAADAEETTQPTTLAAFETGIPSSAPAVDGSPSGYFSPVSFEHSGAATGALQAAAPADDADLASLGKAHEIAGKIAEEHRKAAEAEAKKKAERAEIEKLISKGGLDSWIAEALDHMGMSQSYATGLKQIILKESNGNPDAINNWDSNALAGNPSEGLMQVIPSTFEAYVHPDFADRSVTDPVANITAGVRYMIDRYGLDTLDAGGRTGSHGGYIGY
ncbi:Phage tail length tape-measure protein [Pseudonocardia sp. Ae168_Ps1]|nr:Phage tail length tape-measure protein [Pseudonocardia sp. Ae168_Ps1]OLL84011.1 Phage tail length tape-measure protein [Pseudonocardia sp. Ae263_Ps1]OLL95969.1 Phage tail length tape-measure protein [Pseudonocardia sp. Ae356_Ps1]